MVNDFSVININAPRITRETQNMVALSKGCVRFTTGADLFRAIGDVRDYKPWPDTG